MVGVIGRREEGDRLATLREMGDSANIGLSSSGRLGDSDPLSPQVGSKNRRNFWNETKNMEGVKRGVLLVTSYHGWL